MRKFLSAAAAIITAVCCLTSCSESNNDTSSSETETSGRSRQTRVSSSKIDEDILGTWRSDFQGYRFQDDRNVSLVMDFSNSVHFTSDGKLIVNDEEIAGDMFSYDGKTLNAQIIYEGYDEPADILSLERIDNQTSTSSFDGNYSMGECSYKKFIASSLGMTPEQIDVEVNIEGESFDVTVVDYCLYETNDGKLELFSENMEYVDENANSVIYDYSINGDTLTLT